MSQGRAVTSAQVEKMLAGLRLGMTRRAAAAYGGMAKSTFYRMIEDDGTLRTLVEKAEGEAEGTHTANVALASEKNWQASAWWLERRHPDDYGRRDRVEVTFDFRKEAERLGLDPDEAMAEAEAILAGR